MSGSEVNGLGRSRALGASHAYYGTVLSIVLLLVSWFIIAHWDQLPQVIDGAMAALT
ncbi:MAG TPA: hypothetical protein VNW90_02610 [Acetobacteraceae bacterium]|nr:hypothetical protein [Acetobacteraceae bacterium]